jgi:hypothetical protein
MNAAGPSAAISSVRPAPVMRQGEAPRRDAFERTFILNSPVSGRSQVGTATGFTTVGALLVTLCLWISIALCVLGSPAAYAQSPPPIDFAKARAYFAEDKAVSDKDAGRLWGVEPYGATFFVDPETRFTVANEPDAGGVLHADGDIYAGTLPQSVIISNAPVEWEGKRWTMLMWPYMPDDTNVRRIMFAHESFHRVQPALHLMAPDTPSLHLDTVEGRVWIQLEWRALAAALVETGPAQTQAIRDALLFRAHRRALFPGSGAIEAGQEIAEGVPEYTGTVMGSPDLASARWRMVGRLTDPDQTGTFVRFFAYLSGPPYGMLLDERLPGWRAKLTERSDLGDLLASALPRPPAESVGARGAVYGAAALRISETDRAAKADAEKVRWRALLVDGPTLTLPKAGRFAFSFNPSTLVSLGDAGTVYPTFHVDSGWGTLEVKAGVLVPTDFSRATVAAPSNNKGPHIEGPGWTLDLAKGWSIAPASKAGDYTVRKD